MALVAALGIGWPAGVAESATIAVDGDLGDWGVNLQLYDSGGTYKVKGQTGNYTRFVESSFCPGSGIAYTVSNDNVPTNRGGELCDVEAVYCTFDNEYAYFAVVTSSTPNGSRWDGYGRRRFGPGDVNVTVLRPDAPAAGYGVGARPIDLTVYGRISDLSGPYDQRDALTWDGVTDVNGDGTYYTTSQARIEADPTWSRVNNPGEEIDAYFVGGSGTLTGYADAAWQQWSATGDYYTDDPYGKDEPYGTWILEVAIPRSAMGLDDGCEIGVGCFALDCGNDVLGITDLLVASGNEVPEPLAAIFFGTGLACVWGYVLRRMMRRS